MARKPTKHRGIRRHGAGWQAYVDLKGLPQLVRSFPLNTPVIVMQAWRLNTQVANKPACCTHCPVHCGRVLPHGS